MDYTLDMEIGFESNQSANNTNASVQIYGDNVSLAFSCLSMICTAVIIITNVFVLICFKKHRKILIKSTFTIQILTLSFNDLITGISPLPVFVSPFTSEVTYEFCMFRFVMFLSAQLVVLFHILGICVYSFLIVCQATLPLRRRNQGRLIVVYVLIIWIVALIILSSTFLIWGKYKHILRICSLNDMFQNNYKTVITYWIILFIVPSVFTNAVYLTMILTLCLYARKIAPMNSYNISEPLPSSSNCANSYNFIAGSANNRNKTDGVACKDHSCRNAAGDRKVSCSCNQQRPDLLWANKRPRLKATNDTKTSDNESEEQNGGRSEPNSMPSFKSQRQALITIGLVLGLFDICVVPFLVLFAVEAKIETEIPRNWKLLVTTILTFNSAINPIIYTCKFASFRKAMEETFQTMRSKICCL